MKTDNTTQWLQSNARTELRLGIEEIRAKRPTRTMSQGRSTRTKTTIANILEAAQFIFTRDGHAALSLREVAETAGIAVGNLTYHFPTKRSLLEAMLREAISNDVELHLARIDLDAQSAADVLLSVAEFFVEHGRHTHRFYYQMWGYAGSSDRAKQTVREVFQPIHRLMFQLVREANPHLDHGQINRTVIQIFALEVGYTLLIGLDPDGNPALRSAERDFRALAKRIVFNGDICARTAEAE